MLFCFPESRQLWITFDDDCHYQSILAAAASCCAAGRKKTADQRRQAPAAPLSGFVVGVGLAERATSSSGDTPRSRQNVRVSWR